MGRDWTMDRLELVKGLDRLWPGFSERLSQAERERSGVLLGGITGPGPAGAVLPIPEDPTGSGEAVELAWDSRRTYFLARFDGAANVWVRAYRCRPPVTFVADAFVCTREIESERGVRRWHLITEQDTAVALDTNTGPWSLRGDLSYDLEYDIEGYWKVYGHDTPEGTIPLPGMG